MMLWDRLSPGFQYDKKNRNPWKDKLIQQYKLKIHMDTVINREGMHSQAKGSLILECYTSTFNSSWEKYS